MEVLVVAYFVFMLPLLIVSAFLDDLEFFRMWLVPYSFGVLVLGAALWQMGIR